MSEPNVADPSALTAALVGWMAILDGETRSRADYDPCGECPKGTCDHCHFCEWFAALPGAGRYETAGSR